MSLCWAGFPLSTGSEAVVGLWVMGWGAGVRVSEAMIGTGAEVKLVVSAGKEAVTRW